jgi:phage-related protein
MVIKPYSASVKLKRSQPKPCIFIGSSRRDLAAFPEQVRGDIGHALHEVQCGGEPISAKALKRFGGRAVLEIIENFDGDTFRAVYTVRFAGAVYVLHAFQKKSKKGISTPKHEIERIKARLQDAEEHYRAHTEKGERKP